MYRSVSRQRALRNISAGPGRAQAVAESPDRLDEAVSPTIVDLAPQAPDVDLDDIRAGDVVGAPEGVDEVILGEDLPGMAGEELEHGELARGQPDGAPTTNHAERRWIQLEVVDGDPRHPIVGPSPLE